MADWSKINRICDDIIKNGSYKENLVDIVCGDCVKRGSCGCKKILFVWLFENKRGAE